MFSKQFSGVFNHPAQERHFGEYLSGSIASGNRTIAGIHQRVPSDTAYDSLQHFMTDSPWSVDDMKEKRLTWIKNAVSADQDALTVIAIDSTFAHHTSEKIHGVNWYWDYAQERFCLAQRAVVSTLVSALHLVPLGIQIYHRGFLNKQKLYLEETKPKDDATLEEKKAYQELIELFEKEHKTQLQIAGELVDECEKIGLRKNAYVLDAAFLDKDLMGKIEDYQQAWVTRLPKSRLVQVTAGGLETVETFAKSLPKHAFTRTIVKTRRGEERIYWCFCKNMMLNKWYKKKRVVVSYDNENLDGEPIYLISNKTNRFQAQKIVQIYTMRDPIEHLFRDQKQELGFEDNQQRQEVSVLKHWELSFAAHTFLELGFKFIYPEGDDSAKIGDQSVSDADLRQSNLFVFCVVSLGTALASNLSFPLKGESLLPGLGLIVACMLDQASGAMKYFVYGFSCIFIFAATDLKCSIPFNCERIVQKAGHYSNHKSHLSKLKAFILPQQTIDFVDGTTAIVEKYTGDKDTIYSYPLLKFSML